MAEKPTQLIFNLDAGHDADDQERAELTRRLREYLIEGPADTVDFVRSGSAPIGAKGDPVTLCTLAVTLAPIAVTAVMGMLQSWLARHERASVTVESGGEKLTLTGTLSKEQQGMVEAFLDRHKP
jgi:hypothetical protein